MEELKTRGERAFSIFAATVITVLALLCLAPLILIFIASFTKESYLVANGYSFFPKALSLDAYYYMVSQSKIILRAYGVSILVTGVGTFLSIIMTAMLAYPLSRKDFKYGKIISFIVLFTMLFSGGIAPAYIMWTRVFHIKNTIFALMIPNYLMNAFNVFLMTNYYKNNVPDSLIESAQIDGAGELRIFFKIMLPLSTPAIATIGIFTGLAYWNDWINGLYYITNPKLFGIQNLLVRIMDNIQFLKSGSATSAVGSVAIQLPSNAVRMALAAIGILPILIIFPFVQKYFIKGVVVGAVKG
ncbi:carbohydrate ABC transporter permease [Clostridium sp. YIM B02515]|uniref:Carbohydrate ABC transporter permease n=1 Tax=Clostridium rhizosphaerae TaxID=2803861 RepID=A0ABS1TE46_9CLOT|nr:carbohydrate ABC transporter permease [Clostridium rhizosphaerae]ERI92258.1 ABC transporter, permease protein [Clostridiales bacterium oral taxon 876 str. F0540]MBL4937638.1 carbohydrate ABC transporter permease [Clostridium rhizosphaerae]